MTHHFNIARKLIASALVLLASTSALAEGLEQRTTKAVPLQTSGGISTFLLSSSIPAGTWFISSKASVVNWGEADYVRCSLIVDAEIVDSSTTVIGEAGGAPAVATLYMQKLVSVSRQGQVLLACLHDFPIAGEYVDPGASLILTRVEPARSGH